jgi:hypothetical protein
MQKYGKDLPVKHVGEPAELAEAVGLSIWPYCLTADAAVMTVSLRDEVHVLDGPERVRRRRRTAHLRGGLCCIPPSLGTETIFEQ